MSELILNFVKEIISTESFIALMAAIISLAATRIASVTSQRKDYDKLKSAIRGIVLFVQKDLKRQDGIIRSTAVWEKVTERYSETINKLGFTDQEIKELIERVYEEVRNDRPRLFFDYPEGQPYDSTEIPVTKESK